jgi:hypothetical protein
VSGRVGVEVFERVGGLVCGEAGTVTDDGVAIAVSARVDEPVVLVGAVGDTADIAVTANTAGSVAFSSASMFNVNGETDGDVATAGVIDG